MRLPSPRFAPATRPSGPPRRLGFSLCFLALAWVVPSCGQQEAAELPEGTVPYDELGIESPVAGAELEEILEGRSFDPEILDYYTVILGPPRTVVVLDTAGMGLLPEVFPAPEVLVHYAGPYLTSGLPAMSSRVRTGRGYPSSPPAISSFSRSVPYFGSRDRTMCGKTMGSRTERPTVWSGAASSPTPPCIDPGPCARPCGSSSDGSLTPWYGLSR